MSLRAITLSLIGMLFTTVAFAQSFSSSPSAAAAKKVQTTQSAAPTAKPVIIPVNRPVRIAAVVNDDVITTADAEDRALLLMALTGTGATPESRAKVLSQSLQMLIDERLEMQEAKRNAVVVSDKEIDGAIGAIEQARGRPAGSFLGFVRANGLSESSIRQQFEAQVAWTKTVSRKLKRSVTITDDEITRAQQAALNVKGQPQVLIAALSVPIRSSKEEKAAADIAQSLGAKAASGMSFDTIAREAAGNKNVLLVPAIWMDEARLEPAIAQALRGLEVGQMTQPLRSLSTYQIIQVMDRREVQPISPDTEVALKRIALALPNNANAAQVDTLMGIAREVQQNPGNCNEKGIAGIESFDGLNIAVNYLRQRAKQMSESMRALVLPMGVGEVTMPYATKTGIEMMMLCEKIQAPMPLPDKEQIKEQLFAQRAQLESERMLRNLKRDAFIEVRTGKDQ